MTIYRYISLLSICVTVVVLNVHFRTPQTHTMAPWVRRSSTCAGFQFSDLFKPKHYFQSLHPYSSETARNEASSVWEGPSQVGGKKKRTKKTLLPFNICKLSRLHTSTISLRKIAIFASRWIVNCPSSPKSRKDQRSLLALSLSLTFFCTFSPFSQGVTCSSRPTSPSPPRTTIMRQKRMSSLNWSSASNRARNEKGKELLRLAGNQAGKVGRWQNEGRWWCLFSPWDSLKSVQWAEFLLLAKVFFLTRSTPSSSRHYCNMAFYVYALPQPGEVKEKLFFILFFLFEFINLYLYHSS